MSPALFLRVCVSRKDGKKNRKNFSNSACFVQVTRRGFCHSAKSGLWGISCVMLKKNVKSHFLYGSDPLLIKKIENKHAQKEIAQYKNAIKCGGDYWRWEGKTATQREMPLPSKFVQNMNFLLKKKENYAIIINKHILFLFIT